MDRTLQEKYARLIIKTGINIQPKQTLVVTSPIECAEFTRIITKIAYQEGAREVVINWKDELSSQIRFLEAPEEIFEEFPDWQKDFYLSYLHKGAAFLRISAEDPELMKDVNPERVMKAQKASSSALKEYRENLMSNKNVWSIASMPTKAWAKKVFPKLAEEEAVEELGKAICKTVRADQDDPVAAWKKHVQTLKKSMDIMNSHKFKTLEYNNSLGTNLTIELPEEHIWLGGSEYSASGVEFIANMPTEEIFTLPKKTGVNGTAVSSKPLNYNGNLIEEFTLTFKDGKVVDCSAKKGEEILKKLIATDEGSCYLGEVALVPHESPISQSNILFYNTLFDENASCHLALGKAYSVCIEGSDNKSKEELQKLGMNDSLIHEDFMIGTADLAIVGITANGEKIPVFKDGNFVFK
ncbi:aminopeptidase [Anaerospora hongkongensis]|uniref:aminopeptidase n=1 Tax=Anaerospora hongkongensis TaxID=244830 RepID=UPI00289E85A6|nr:aminopeptidase [Anaerospora hongkongensis]